MTTEQMYRVSAHLEHRDTGETQSHSQVVTGPNGAVSVRDWAVYTWLTQWPQPWLVTGWALELYWPAEILDAHGGGYAHSSCLVELERDSSHQGTLQRWRGFDDTERYVSDIATAVAP